MMNRSVKKHVSPRLLMDLKMACRLRRLPGCDQCLSQASAH